MDISTNINTSKLNYKVADNWPVYNAILQPTSIEFSKIDTKNENKLLDAQLKILKTLLNKQMRFKLPDYAKHIAKYHRDADNPIHLQYRHGIIMEQFLPFHQKK